MRAARANLARPSRSAGVQRRVSAAAAWWAALLLLGACLIGGCAPRPTPSAPDGAVSEGDPPPLDLSVLEREVHAAVNEARQRHGLPLLGWHEALASVARARSEEMAAYRYFEHVNRRGEDAFRRVRRAQVACRVDAPEAGTRSVGENLFALYHYRSVERHRQGSDTRFVFHWRSTPDMARTVVEGWLESPGHRANLLSPDFEAHGIGVARGDHHLLYITQNLCAAAPDPP